MKPHTRCRVCDTVIQAPYLDLGVQPLANAFLRPEDVGAPEFTAPLQVALCATCGLSQLTVVVAPERLYSFYPYVSGVSAGWRTHCGALAREYTRVHGSKKFVLEIASGDGTLLRAFQARGHRVLGIEPAQNVTEDMGVPALPLFWNADVAKQVRHTNGPADLVVATNVLGHVDDVRDFLTGVRLALDPWGIAILECPHIMPLLSLRAFDTIYHEHLSYWSLGPLQRLAQDCGLCVFECKPQFVHGGTMRYSLCHTRAAHFTDSVLGLWKRELEAGLRTPEPYQELATCVAAVRPKLQEAFARAGLHGLGASAKGNTLLNYAQLTLPAIFDESPRKQGRLTPGRHIPVRALPATLQEVPALALLSWNCASELKQKARDRAFTGEFLTPIPEPHWSQ